MMINDKLHYTDCKAVGIGPAGTAIARPVWELIKAYQTCKSCLLL